jgi:hypothetical protein
MSKFQTSNITQVGDTNQRSSVPVVPVTSIPCRRGLFSFVLLLCVYIIQFTLTFAKFYLTFCFGFSLWILSTEMGLK